MHIKIVALLTLHYFSSSKACLPHLLKGTNPHILNLSPPLNLNPIWFENHLAYTIAKYGMSLCVLGMHKEFKNNGVAVNALWPKTGMYFFLNTCAK